MEGISETLTTKKKNYVIEIKDSINKMRNTLDSMDSRLKEEEE